MFKVKTLKLTSPEPHERDVQKIIVRRLCAANWLVLKINGSGFTDSRGQFVRSYFVYVLGAAAGFPDLLALKGTSHGIMARLIEIKAADGQLSESQERFIAFAARFGIAVEVVEGVHGLEQFDSQLFGAK